jgi:hypothetical protein
MIYAGVANAGKGRVALPNPHPTERHFLSATTQVNLPVAPRYDVLTTSTAVKIDRCDVVILQRG